MIRLLLLSSFLLIGCAPREPIYYLDGAQTGFAKQVRGSAESSGEAPSTEQSPFSERVVQYSATVNIDTEKPDSLFRRVLNLTTTYNGYMLRSNETQIAVRVPSKDFVTFLNTVYTYGKVLSKEIEGIDVTEDFFDLTTRLDNAQKARQRYLDLLNKAQTVESALAVERELERLNREIDLLSGRLNRLKHLSDFSTVVVTTTAPVRPGPIGYVFYGIYSAIRWLFVWD